VRGKLTPRQFVFPHVLDALAMHVKLNEIIKAVEGASNHIVKAESLSEATLSRLQERYQEIAENAARRGDPPPAKEEEASNSITRKGAV
jgi:low affinity Fe/Cu permease